MVMWPARGRNSSVRAAVSGADLDHDLVGDFAERFDDGFGGAAVDEEVLSEFGLAGNQFGRVLARRCCFHDLAGSIDPCFLRHLDSLTRLSSVW